MRSVTSEDPDLTAKARIRDAAISRFAADGVGKTTVRAIASEAGVSAGLVIHHFGSKDALRVECDRYIAAYLAEQKTDAMRTGPGLDPLGALRSTADGPPVMKYLARTLVENSPGVAEMVDTIVADAAGYLEEGVRSGLLKPTEHPRERAAILSLYSLGMLTLHEHAQRILGVDLLGEPSGMHIYLKVAGEILVSGIGTEALEQMITSAFAQKGNEHE